MIRKLQSRFLHLFDLSYTLRFIIKFVALYFLFNLFHYVWIGVASPGGGIYSPFIGHYLNYEVFIRESCLQVGVFLADFVGAHSHLSDGNTVRVDGGGYLFMGRPCIGLELLSFWAAFVIADTTSFYRKLIWCLAGWFSIWAINSLRVGLLIIATKERWQLLHLDQHTLFTAVAYLLIFLLIFIYYRKNKKQLALQTLRF